MSVFWVVPHFIKKVKTCKACRKLEILKKVKGRNAHKRMKTCKARKKIKTRKAHRKMRAC